MTLSIMTLTITTLSFNKGLISDAQQNITPLCAVCQYAECRVLFIIVLNLVMPNVIVPNVVMSLCRVTWRR